MNNPFSNVISKFKDASFNPFKPKNKEEDLKEKSNLSEDIDRIKNLIDIVESLEKDERYIKVKRLKEEKLTTLIYLLKNKETIDPNIAYLQSKIISIEDDLNMLNDLNLELKKAEVINEK